MLLLLVDKLSYIVHIFIEFVLFPCYPPQSCGLVCPHTLHVPSFAIDPALVTDFKFVTF